MTVAVLDTAARQWLKGLGRSLSVQGLHLDPQNPPPKKKNLGTAVCGCNPSTPTVRGEAETG